MNPNQEQPTTSRLSDNDAQQQNKGHEVDDTRRRFTRIGVGTPVILSLMSKPVLGAQCLSNMLSGNLSDPTRGTCSAGWSPGGWKNAGGKISTFSTIEAWSRAGFSYQESTASTAPFAGLLQVSDSNMRLVDVLRQGHGSLNAGIICAYLNASLSENTGGNTGGAFKYVLTREQVIGLVMGTIPLPPAYGSLHDFFYSTW